jgi:hypothetical protein
MRQPHASRQYDPNRLLDALSMRLGSANDRMLSSMLRMSPEIIKSIRSGRLPLRASLLLSMAESVGISIEELRLVLGDRRATSRMSYSILATAKRHANN